MKRLAFIERRPLRARTTKEIVDLFADRGKQDTFGAGIRWGVSTKFYVRPNEPGDV